jgi:NMD protein affecting ribosome stability and mRNA decay
MDGLRCPVCGKSSEGVCVSCYLRDHPIAVKKQPLRECGCGLLFFKGRWYDDRKAMFRDFAQGSMKPPAGVEARVKSVDVSSKAGRTVLDAVVEGSYGGAVFEETLHWDVKPERVRCDVCRKLGSGYYEAVLQVRGESPVLDLDERQIGKVERVRGGLDYYLISLDYARAKAAELADGGYIIKKSSKIHGVKNGKTVYRHYFSVKKPPFAAGYFIEHKGKPMRVVELGKTVKLADLETGKVKSASLHQLEDAKVLAQPRDVRKAMVTEVRPDGMQVMDEDGYETHQLPLKQGLTAGQGIEYVRIRKRMYVL